MSNNRKYYYLKLKDNFFDSDSQVVLESMQDGYLYSNILLKLYLRSLKNNGKLMFNDRIPYNSTILSKVVRHNVGVVEKALSIFKELDISKDNPYFSHNLFNLFVVGIKCGGNIVGIFVNIRLEYSKMIFSSKYFIQLRILCPGSLQPLHLRWLSLLMFK